MDLIREVVSTPYAFPAGIVAVVISCAILVFVFGFKSAEEPPFDQLSFANDDRKPAGKKRKLKDKKSQSNGHATSVKEKTSKPVVEADATKSSKQSPKQQTKDGPKDQPKKKDPVVQQQVLKEKEKASSANKKAVVTPSKQTTPKKAKKETQDALKKNKKQEKVDDDDGWEQVGKKNKSRTQPTAQEEKEKSSSASPKKEKKSKKPAEIEKLSPEVKDTSPKVPKDKVSDVVEGKPLTTKEKSPKKAPTTDKSSDEKPVVSKNVDPEPQISGVSKVEVKKEEKKEPQAPGVAKVEVKKEEKKDKKKKIVPESTSFIDNERAAVVKEGKGDAPVSSGEKPDGAVFDELGDVWTEKVPKKSKKKVRKE